MNYTEYLTQVGTRKNAQKHKPLTEMSTQTQEQGEQA